MKRSLILVTGLFLYSLSFAGSDFLVKRFAEKAGTGAEQRIASFKAFITTGQQTGKTDAVEQRIIGRRYSEFVDGTWYIQDSARWSYTGLRGSADEDNDVFDVRYDLLGSGTTAQNDKRNTNTFDANGRLVTKVIENWTGVGFENYQKKLYTYDANGNMLTYTRQDWDGTNWIDNIREVFAYDAANNNISYTQQGWNGSTWDDNNRFQYTYNAAHQMLTSLYQQMSGGMWTDISRDTYTYDANGDNTEYLEELYGTGWENYSRKTYTYNGHHQVTMRIFEAWTGSAWENSSKKEFTYDAAFNEINSIDYSWQSGAWNPTYQYLTEYDANNRRTFYTTQVWTGQWNNGYRDAYTYDANGYPDWDTYQNWSPAMSMWMDNNRSDYDYNSYGNPDVHSYIEFGEEGPVDISKEFFYYETYGQPNGIAEIDPLLMSVYPNPVATRLQVAFTSQQAGNATLHVYGINGQLLLSNTIAIASGENVFTIPVEALFSGVYMLELTCNGASSHTKFVKQ